MDSVIYVLIGAAAFTGDEPCVLITGLQATGALADKANLPGRVTQPEGICRDILRHHGAGPNHGIFADCMSRQDHGICSDRASRRQYRTYRFVEIRLASGIQIIGEYGVRTDKYIIFNREAIPERNSVFHSNSITHCDVLFDKAVIADIAIPTDNNICLHVAKCPDTRTVADLIGGYQSRVMHKVIAFHIHD